MNDQTSPWIEFAIRLSFSSTLLLASTLMLRQFLRQYSAAVRHLVALTGCLAMLPMTVGLLVLPHLHLSLLGNARHAYASSLDPSQPDQITAPTPSPTEIVSSRNSFAGAVTAMMSQNAPQRIGKSNANPSSRSAATHRQPLSVSSCLLIVYLSGLLWCLVRLVSDHVSARRLRHGATPSTEVVRIDQSLDGGSVGLFFSDRVSVPIVLGIWRPAILFPHSASEWPTEQLRSALRHELAHVERRDLLTQFFVRLVQSVYWPQPLIHLISFLMQRDREFACDERAAITSERPMMYARHLLAIAAENSHASNLNPAVLAMARKSEVETRIQRILKLNLIRAASKRITAASCVTVLAVSTLVSVIDPVGSSDRLNANEPPTAVSGKSGDQSKVSPSKATASDDPTSQENGVEFEKHSVAGQVVDDRGNPIRNVQIFVPKHSSPAFRDYEIQQTDELGRFDLDLRRRLGSFNAYDIWFYKPGFAVRTAKMMVPLKNKRRVSGLIIPLPEEDELEFRVIRPDGAPCTEATLTPRSVHVPNGRFMADQPTGLMGPPPEALAGRLSQHVDQDGSAVFRAIPRDLLSSVVLDTKDYGSQIYQMDQVVFGDVTELVLKEVGALRGRVVTPNPRILAGTKLTIETDARDNSRTGRGIAIVELADEGTFEVPAIAAWERLEVRFGGFPDPTRRPLLDASYREEFAIRAGETVELSIPTKPIATVSGRVLVSEDGPAVVGATLVIRNAESLFRGNSIKTDSSGRYTVKVPAGEIRQQMISLGFDRPEAIELAKRYSHPRLPGFTIKEGDTDVRRPVIYLAAKQEIAGQLMDSNSQPLSDVSIGLRPLNSRFLDGVGTTDKSGHFSVWVRPFEEWGQRRWDRGQYEWVIIDKEAQGSQPRQESKLDVVTKDKKAMVLRRP